MDEIEKKEKPKSNWWAEPLFIFLHMSGWIAGPLIIAIFIGKGLDKKYDSEPWGFLSLIGIAFLVSMFGIIKKAMEEMKKLK